MAACLHLASSIMARTLHIPKLLAQFLICLQKSKFEPLRRHPAGSLFVVGVMLDKESVKTRIESEEGISYTEFTYQLLQGYDFLHLFKHHGVNVQIGGSDQWGNITAGTELIRKKLQDEGAYGLTFPLLLKSDGSKFGKSESGDLWLSSSALSPYKFYKYFFSVPDVDVVRFLKMLTFLSLEEIAALEEGIKKPGYVPNSLQRKLAEEITSFC